MTKDSIMCRRHERCSPGGCVSYAQDAENCPYRAAHELVAAPPPSAGSELVPGGVGIDAQQDTDWIRAFGGEVTKQSPPVGSIAVGIAGVGFDLVEPDGEIVASWDAHGVPLPPGAIGTSGGARVPAITSEADDGPPEAPDGLVGA